ncbi:hypothetical protein H8S90_14735 [Olivibacter sp. SDN3]|uniref:hypothetical protein n=1 Tax=Olivibacter sp. SDN3 TaxID=2764720 RepID=UPI001650F235|nr:hypothetical protein [Olivibacter sp. SDN3]QNL48062.1 hypothetical protein H8S90_14735 [Olivibacter sp. SDN3]
MLLFNLILLVHFICFIAYFGTLVKLWSNYHTAQRSYTGLILGIVLLLSGILLVITLYPDVNYYKVVPKTVMFALITGINIKFGNRAYTKNAYYSLIILTLAAACLAVVNI